MSQNKSHPIYDVAIIGAGINGAVSAAALCSRGLRVLLVDARDFGGLTSSQSSNLIWGGIKYLQTYEFGLVFKLSRARAKLMKNYPTQVKTVGFFAALGPNAPFGRVLGRFGTLFYWAIGLFSTPLPLLFSVSEVRKLEPTVSKERLRGAVEYFDGLMPDNDARFVWKFVARARELGATVMNYHELTHVDKRGELFDLQITDKMTGITNVASARVVINSSGPFVKDANLMLGSSTKKDLVFSKGIHLVVRKLTSDNRVLTFWDEQGRIFYVIPMHDRTLIGTTDTRVADPLEQVTAGDREFVLRQMNISMNLETPLTVEDIISERCGVRALVVNRNTDSSNADWHKLSRKHAVESDEEGVISILGGKFTDCLNVGEEIIGAVKKHISVGPQLSGWFGEGGEKENRRYQGLAAAYVDEGIASQEVVDQLWRRHGEQASKILEQLRNNVDDRDPVFTGLAITFGELRHIAQHEEVKTAEDLLRRRLPLAMIRSKKEISENRKLQDLLVELSLNH